MAFPLKKVSNPALEKREEKVKKDLDNDGEKGESPAHQKKVLGKVSPFAKSKGKGGKLCPKCKKTGKSSCSHM